MNENYSFKLIEQVKLKCYISSDDELIQNRLLSIVNNAQYSVRSILGIYKDDFDFSQPGLENELFLNYCMYRWNNLSQKEFEENYIGDIIAIRTKNEINYKNEREKSNEEHI